MLRYLYHNIRAIARLSAYRTPRPTVLMYHSIGRNRASATVKPKAFRRQMEWLKENDYRVVTLDECVAAGRRGETGKIVALTFDDGYRDFMSEALSTLTMHKYPAALFIITGKMGWKHRLFDGLAASLMTWHDARIAAHAPGVTVGSHSQSHVMLTKLDEDEALRELAESRREVAEKIGQKPAWFCYPFGRHSKMIRELAKEAGYVGALGITHGHPGPDTDPFAVPRGSVHAGMSHLEFLALFV